MKNISSHLCLLAALTFAVTALPSCVVYEDVTYSESYGGNSYGSSRQPQYRDGRGYSPFGQNQGQYYGRSNSRYDRHDDHRGHDHFAHSSSRHDDHRGHDHYDRHDNHRDDHHKSEPKKKDDNLKHHPNSYRIAGGSTGSKTKPKGYHSVSWYKSRGYDVNKLTLKNEKGQTYKKKR